MDGVTILNTYASYSFLWALGLSAGIVSVVFLFVISFHMLDENVVISGICFGLTIIVALGCIAIPKTETIHEVILDDTVSWVEFDKHYRVQQQRGRILKVKERSIDGGQDSHTE